MASYHQLSLHDLQRLSEAYHKAPFEGSYKNPLCYYENKDVIIICQPINNIIYFTEVKKSELPAEFKNLENFKMEYLSNALELISKPKY